MKEIHLPSAETGRSEDIRRELTKAVNLEAKILTPEALANKYGQLWDTKQLQEDYEVRAFGAPFVEVVRKRDNVRGLLMFSHHPRFYHSFEEV